MNDIKEKMLDFADKILWKILEFPEWCESTRKGKIIGEFIIPVIVSVLAAATVNLLILQ